MNIYITFTSIAARKPGKQQQQQQNCWMVIKIKQVKKITRKYTGRLL